MSSSYSIYAVSLADYNAGIHHGRWICVLDDSETVQAEIDAMLAESPTAASTGLPAEEWAIHDHDFEFEGITINEHTPTHVVCALAAALEEHGEPFAALWGYETFFNVEEAVERFEESYQGTFRSLEEWAEEYADDTGMLDSIPENLRYYFDFERFARDCDINGDINGLEVSGGVAVFNRY